MNAEWTINTILNRIEDLTVSQVYKYNKQECINSKPSLQSGNEELKEYNCELKLHADFCNPKRIIDILKKQQESREAFEWIYRGEYKGSFVIERLEEQEISRLKDVLIFAKINFNLIEIPQELEFEQQKTGEADLSQYEQFSENSNRLKDFALQAKNLVTENLKNTVMNIALSENLSDSAIEIFEQVKNGVINNIENGNIADIYSDIQNYSNIIERSNVETSDLKVLLTSINSIPQNILHSALIGG